MINDTDAGMVIFSKAQVRHCKTAHFLKSFGPSLASPMKHRVSTHSCATSRKLTLRPFRDSVGLPPGY
jgi:hypothetical protein